MDVLTLINDSRKFESSGFLDYVIGKRKTDLQQWIFSLAKTTQVSKSFIIIILIAKLSDLLKQMIYF